MPDLFSTSGKTIEPLPKKINRGSKGRFTTKADAELFQARQEAKKYKTIADYYKRVAERLSNEIKNK